MAMFILLTAEQADQVRGPSESAPYAALNPIERAGGVFILGVEVLQAPYHEVHAAFLGGLPQMDENDPDFPGEIQPPE